MTSMGIRILMQLAAAAFLAAILNGCLTAEREEVNSAGGEIFVLPSAHAIRGAMLGDLTVSSEVTVLDAPMTSRTIRSTAQDAKKAVLSLYVQTSTPYRVRLLPIRLPFGGISVRLKGIGLGSGFFIHPEGYVLTNNHVVEDASIIQGLTADGTDLELEVLARDPTFDLALLRVKKGGASYPYLRMGDSEMIDVGDHVIAVGNPLGLGHTVTSGIVSQTGRNLTGVVGESERRIDFIQTDAAINAGSSGGPLVTLTGAWVGINTAKLAEAQGIGFAVPSKHVIEFLNNVLSAGDVLEGQN